jgi:hypothetical protein
LFVVVNTEDRAFWFHPPPGNPLVAGWPVADSAEFFSVREEWKSEMNPIGKRTLCKVASKQMAEFGY